MEIFSSAAGVLTAQDTITPGCWIRLIVPSGEEIAAVSRNLGLDSAELMVLLDEEELPRIEQEEHYTLVLVDTPYKQNEDDITSYQTIPAAFVILPDCLLTVSLRRNPILDKFASGKVKNFDTGKPYRFLLQFLYAKSTALSNSVKHPCNLGPPKMDGSG